MAYLIYAFDVILVGLVRSLGHEVVTVTNIVAFIAQ